MPRKANAVATETLKLSTTPQTLAALDELVATGLFGKTRTEAAEQLLRERLRELVNQEWIPRPKRRPKP